VKTVMLQPTGVNVASGPAPPAPPCGAEAPAAPQTGVQRVKMVMLQSTGVNVDWADPPVQGG
jgi:hypothetical protein